MLNFWADSKSPEGSPQTLEEPRGKYPVQLVDDVVSDQPKGPGMELLK